MTPELLIEDARKLVGNPRRREIPVPWVHQGRSLLGMDCVGFIIFLLEQRGLMPAEINPNDYGRLASDELVEQVKRHCVQIDGPEPGCLVLIRWPKDRRAGHAALCTGQTLIHCDRTHGCVVEHGYRGPWLRMTASLWRLPGVRYG